MAEKEEYMCFRDDAFVRAAAACTELGLMRRAQISLFGLSADNAIDYFSRCGA